jgi:alpha-aminoadipate/glutamate carrier protein LysW
MERVMAICPNCEAPDLEVDEYELEEGEIITCSDCGASLQVTSLSPVELDVLADDDDEDDEDEEDDEDGDDLGELDDDADDGGDEQEQEDMDE